MKDDIGINNSLNWGTVNITTTEIPQESVKGLKESIGTLSQAIIIRDQKIEDVNLFVNSRADDFLEEQNKIKYVSYTDPHFKYKDFATEEEAVAALNEYLDYEYNESYEGTYVLLKEFNSHED